jgi:SAM-dependent methyltransferase
MDPREVTAIFDARAAGYATDDWHRRYADQLVAAAPLRAGETVLDAGTGTGFAACAIAQRVGPSGRVVGVDVSAGMLAQARRLAEAAGLTNVEFVEADAANLEKYAAGTFDAVICSSALLYMNVAKALSDWHRLLKTGGVIAFSTMRAGSPSAGRIFRECAAKYGLTLSDPSEELGSEARCRKALEAAGFEVVRLLPDRVDFVTVDPVLAWEANSRAGGHAAARSLDADQQAALRQEFVAALEADAGSAARADVIFAIGRRIPNP